MQDSLLDAVRRHAEAHADGDGVARTAISGLSLIRQTRPTALKYEISKPLVALVLQGRKQVAMGNQRFDFGAGESLLIAADVPNVSQITRASAGTPYFSMVVDLDTSVIEKLVVEMGASSAAEHVPLRIEPTDNEVADTALRLMRLLDKPADLAMLREPLIRELHFWLLRGQHGGAIRTLGVAESHVRRISRAVSVIRADYAKPVRVEKLAEVAGMSLSAFHQHFRAVTSLTPLQFVKQARLIEARRMMLADRAPISNAAYAVGYESIPQFTREYGRMFGLTPARDMRATKDRMLAAA